MPGKKQKKRTRKVVPVSVDTGFDIGHEIEQGLKALAGKAREGDPRYLRCGDWGFLKWTLAAGREFAHVPEYLATGRKIEGMSVHFDGVERYEQTVKGGGTERKTVEKTGLG